jgi:hypothetical protein
MEYNKPSARNNCASDGVMMQRKKMRTAPEKMNQMKNVRLSFCGRKVGAVSMIEIDHGSIPSYHHHHHHVSCSCSPPLTTRLDTLLPHRYLVASMDGSMKHHETAAEKHPSNSKFKQFNR